MSWGSFTSEDYVDFEIAQYVSTLRTAKSKEIVRFCVCSPLVFRRAIARLDEGLAIDAIAWLFLVEAIAEAIVPHRLSISARRRLELGSLSQAKVLFEN
jgi:hypothetical protein